MARVAGKIALITGGGRGIGEESVRLLSAEGATVIVTDILEEQGRAVADRVNGMFYSLDVSDEKAWQRVTQSIEEKFGRLDIVFNNAGITGLGEDLNPQDPEHISLDSWHHVHRINLDGVFLGCKWTIPLMKRCGGSIINMSSRSGLVGVPGACAYASSKAAVRNHTKSVALYCAEQGYHIRCNSLHPGAILTPIWEAMLGEDEAARKEKLDTLVHDIPLGVMGKPLDVANIVLYLGSDESKYVTGTEFIIDGGILAGSSASPKKN